MKCSICGEKIERTFLDKIEGTYYNIKGELKPVCQSCQKKYNKKKIKKELKG